MITYVWVSEFLDDCTCLWSSIGADSSVGGVLD